MDFHAQLGYAPVEEAAEIVDLRADAGTHQVLNILGRG
jgi:hypothetical protein